MLQKEKSAKSTLATFPLRSQHPPRMTWGTIDVAANSNNQHSADVPTFEKRV